MLCRKWPEMTDFSGSPAQVCARLRLRHTQYSSFASFCALQSISGLNAVYFPVWLPITQSKGCHFSANVTRHRSSLLATAGLWLPVQRSMFNIQSSSPAPSLSAPSLFFVTPPCVSQPNGRRNATNDLCLNSISSPYTNVARNAQMAKTTLGCRRERWLQEHLRHLLTSRRTNESHQGHASCWYRPQPHRQARWRWWRMGANVVTEGREGSSMVADAASWTVGMSFHRPPFFMIYVVHM